MNLSRGNCETIKKKKKNLTKRWGGGRKGGVGEVDMPHACKKIFSCL